MKHLEGFTLNLLKRCTLKRSTSDMVLVWSNKNFCNGNHYFYHAAIFVICVSVPRTKPLSPFVLRRYTLRGDLQFCPESNPRLIRFKLIHVSTVPFEFISFKCYF